MCRHVCMHACNVSMYMDACMHACDICTYIYVCMHACMYICMYLCIHVCLNLPTSFERVGATLMHMCMYVCMHASIRICMHAHTQMCMYIWHTCMHTYIPPECHFSHPPCSAAGCLLKLFHAYIHAHIHTYNGLASSQLRPTRQVMLRCIF